MPSDAKKIFIVGIGGIGVSALARILKGRGREVTGSDVAASEVTSDLVSAGIPVAIGHRADNLPPECGLLIYSNAVPKDNPERAEAARRGVKQQSYPEALGKLLNDYEKVIAVAGTNGKTTTTAMIGWILEQAGYDPTVLVGSKVLAWNSNARIGGMKYFVLEADEYKRAFLNYHPDIAVITNIAADHLDYYKDLDDVKSAFLDFARNIKKGGKLIEGWKIVSLREISRREKNWKLRIPGRFNQENATCAAAVCRVLQVPEEKIAEALCSFAGTWRRFELVARRFIGNREISIISDYAHHPDGIRVTLQAVYEYYPGKKILTVFQPHQHNRTKMLFKEFVEAFCTSKLNDFIISEIFDVAGREESQDQNVSSQDLVREIKQCGKNVEYAADLDEAEKIARARLGDYDMIIFMGAGDIYTVANKIANAS